MKLKRLFDFFVALIFIIISLPIIFIISIFLILDQGRPIFFLQKRVGLYGEVFQIIKFRTMIINSNSDGTVSDLDSETSRRVYKTTCFGDSRITRIGRHLRKSHLDELPQFLCVLLGYMSLVGPRPDVPVQKSDYSLVHWEKRCSVKPGITGLAQVNPKRCKSTRSRLAMDLIYINKSGVCMDIVIIFKTIIKVFKRSSD